MEKLVIRSALKEYTVLFDQQELLPEHPYDFYFVDENIYNLRKEIWQSKRIFILPAGEKCKEINTYSECVKWLENQKAHRSSTLVAVGGGAILDCVGFVASTYLRGIEWVGVPTTLLSMVDSCIGGKVGLNVDHEKNRIGTFYPPSTVWICQDWLKTLPQKELQSGYAEIIKTAALENGVFWKEVLNYSLSNCIKSCLEYKAKIVERDEFEKDNISGRFSLNAGHTVAHGLEGLYPGRFLHGEAVSIGLVIETEFGVKNGSCDPLFLEDLKRKLSHKELPLDLPKDIDLNHLIKILLKDKKGDGNSLNLSIILTPGKCKMISGISIDLFKIFLKEKIGVDKT